MIRTIDRKLLRDLARIKGLAAAVALVAGSGVAMLVMSLGTLNSIEATRAAYYERYRFADIFAPLKRAPQSLSARIAAIPGVKWVEARIVKDVTLDVAGMDEPATGRLISIPPRRRPHLNEPTLRRGRHIDPARPDEVLVGEAFAKAHGLGPGGRLAATINGRRRTLDIVGVALSPEYVYAIGPGVLVPDNRRFGVLWMGQGALAAAFDLQGAFNDVSLSLLRSASAAEVIDRLDDLLRPYGGIGAYDRGDQVSDSYLRGEIEQLGALSTIVPPIFLAVAAFLLNIVISRLVETERGQIGLLKAFGYSDWAVGRHYLKLALAIAALGLAFGFLAGAYLGRATTEMYTQFFAFPFLHYRPSPDTFAIAGLVTVAASLAAAAGAVRRAARMPPAEAMAPALPTAYRRTLLERLGAIAPMAQPTRMIFRHIVRWPGRAAFTCLGIALGAALMISTLFFYDAIDHMIETYFHHAQRQDVTVTLVEAGPERTLGAIAGLPGVLSAESYRVAPARLRHGHLAERVAIIGLAADAELRRALDTRLLPFDLPPDGIVLSTKLAELLRARPGHTLTVEFLEGRRPVRRVAVAALVEEYIGTPAYMERRALNRLLREGPTISGAYLMVDSRREAALYRRLKDTPAVAGVGLQTAALRTFRQTMAETMDIMISFYVGFGALIAIGVVYNAARVSLSERARELASLRVLGFTRGEVFYILFGELTVLTLAALPLGCVLGYGLAWLMSLNFDTELFRVPLVVQRDTYGAAVAAVIAAAVGSGLLVRRRLDRLDLISALKTRE